ncbi:MAG: DNA/RNA nuclease SfsA, partial [Lachnospiraceae bacterium]|nr:DNA/RNA nuclease SfsA [Lachnospiraceae bacterium]
MKYENIKKGRFLERPNRFIAYAEIDGKREKVHVKNTGRCRELLVPDAEMYLEKSTNTNRSTAYDLITVKKGDRLVNMDSNAPNKAVEEWLSEKKLFRELTYLRPETVYQNSRFDFYAEYGNKEKMQKVFIEVKGVTLEEDQ